MQISDLYRLAAAHNHEIISLPLKETLSFAIEDRTGCHIALSDKLTRANKKAKLAHELGHCEYGGFYNYHSPYSVRSKCEASADRWAYLHLLPIDNIQEAIEAGCGSIWEISERFDLPCEFVEAALRFYIDQLGIRG